MAKTEFIEPIQSISGRINKKSNVYFRQMYGRTHAIQLLHPRTKDKASEKENRYRAKVGALSKEASRINKDEALAAAYAGWQQKGYSSRYRYILAELIRRK